METQDPKPGSDSPQAVEHVAGAHRLLKALQDKLGEHPEIGQAVNKLEMALAILEIKTGGMLYPICHPELPSASELSFRSVALLREESAVSPPTESRFLADKAGFGMTKVALSMTWVSPQRGKQPFLPAPVVNRPADFGLGFLPQGVSPDCFIPFIRRHVETIHNRHAPR
jgi:hypothetical protein